MVANFGENKSTFSIQYCSIAEINHFFVSVSNNILWFMIEQLSNLNEMKLKSVFILLDKIY